MESISKPFVYALALVDQGENKLNEKVGINATGHAYNSVLAIEEQPNHLQNALVNAGAIQVTSLIAVVPHKMAIVVYSPPREGEDDILIDSSHRLIQILFQILNGFNAH